MRQDFLFGDIHLVDNIFEEIDKDSFWYCSLQRNEEERVEWFQCQGSALRALYRYFLRLAQNSSWSQQRPLLRLKEHWISVQNEKSGLDAAPASMIVTKDGAKAVLPCWSQGIYQLIAGISNMQEILC